MKCIVVPILIILIMTQAFSKWIVIAEFNIYRSYIASHLCENRFRPQMHCNGKCVLMKKMAADEINLLPLSKKSELQYNKIDLTGGSVLSSSLGAEFSFNRVSVGFNVQVPITQNFAENQTKEKSRGMVHISIAI